MRAGRNILIVDDDYVFAGTTASPLRHAGFRVTTGHHFESALQALEAVPIVDLLITDLVMPGSVNGIASSRLARVRCPAIKVIFVTGYDVPGAEQEATGPILRKPIDPDVLIDLVEEALALRH